MFIEIDGSYGEGGGQILRTSLALSAILKRPIRIFNIRKKRDKPGLRPQHLNCVKALQELTQAEVEGDSISSTELHFSPKKVCSGGKYRFDIGTAGSITLLLQAILPVLILSQENFNIEVKGGTHVPHSPTFDYFNEVFVWHLRRMGFSLNAEISNYGFYPKGGGSVKVKISPYKKLKVLDLTERGKIKGVFGTSAVGGLPLEIAERQREAAIDVLKAHNIQPDIDVRSVPSPGKGTYVFLKVVSENFVSGFSSLGRKGKRAELVGKEAAEEALQFIRSNACIDHYLADQIIPYIALIGGRWRIRIPFMTEHLKTNLWAVSHFLDLTYSSEEGFLEIEATPPLPFEPIK